MPEATSSAPTESRKRGADESLAGQPNKKPKVSEANDRSSVTLTKKKLRKRKKKRKLSITAPSNESGAANRVQEAKEALQDGPRPRSAAGDEEGEDLPMIMSEKKKGKQKAKSEEPPTPGESRFGASAQETIDMLRKELERKTCLIEKHERTLTALAPNLTCQVCLDLMHKPFMLVPCGHIACYSCLVRWFTEAPPGVPLAANAMQPHQPIARARSPNPTPSIGPNGTTASADDASSRASERTTAATSSAGGSRSLSSLVSDPTLAPSAAPLPGDTSRVARDTSSLAQIPAAANPRINGTISPPPLPLDNASASTMAAVANAEAIRAATAQDAAALAAISAVETQLLTARRNLIQLLSVRRHKSCPHCRGCVTTRPVEVYAIKSMASVVHDSGFAPGLGFPPLEPETGSTSAANGTNTDPWHGIFPLVHPGSLSHPGVARNWGAQDESDMLFDIGNMWPADYGAFDNDGMDSDSDVSSEDGDSDLDDLLRVVYEGQRDEAADGASGAFFDAEDLVHRCTECMHEVWDGVCSNETCRREYPGLTGDDILAEGPPRGSRLWREFNHANVMRSMGRGEEHLHEDSDEEEDGYESSFIDDADLGAGRDNVVVVGGSSPRRSEEGLIDLTSDSPSPAPVTSNRSGRLRVLDSDDEDDEIGRAPASRPPVVSRGAMYIPNGTATSRRPTRRRGPLVITSDDEEEEEARATSGSEVGEDCDAGEAGEAASEVSDKDDDDDGRLLPERRQVSASVWDQSDDDGSSDGPMPDSGNYCWDPASPEDGSASEDEFW